MCFLRSFSTTCAPFSFFTSPFPWNYRLSGCISFLNSPGFCTDLDHFRDWNVNGFHLEILHSQAEWCEKKMVEKERKNIYKLSGVNGKMYWSNLHFRGNINMYRNLYALCREKWEGKASTLCHSEEVLALLTLQMKRNMVRAFWKVAQMKQSLEKHFIEPHPIGLWFIFVLVSSLATNQVSKCQVNLKGNSVGLACTFTGSRLH